MPAVFTEIVYVFIKIFRNPKTGKEIEKLVDIKIEILFRLVNSVCKQELKKL